MTGSTIMPDSERLTLSTSATCSSIERLRWTMPSPPSRASAIAIRASVTVSIAAERIGISSAIVRVSRVAVRTSFGSTADSAGTSSTSSKVRPSRPNFSSYESSCPSKERQGIPRLHGRLEQPTAASSTTSTAPTQPADVARVEAAGADLERRGGAGRDGEPQRVLGRLARRAGRR